MVSRGTLVTIPLVDDRDTTLLGRPFAYLSRELRRFYSPRGVNPRPCVYSGIIPLSGSARGLNPVGTGTRKAVPRFKPLGFRREQLAKEPLVIRFEDNCVARVWVRARSSF